jgi:hypothetical protein
MTNMTGLEFDDQIYWAYIQLFMTVHKSLSDTLSSSDWTFHANYSDFQLNSSTPLYSFVSFVFLYIPLYSFVLLRTPSVLLTVSSYNSSARAPRKTPASVVKNACLLVRYLVLESVTSGMCWA